MPTIAYNALVLQPPWSGVEKSVAELARALLEREGSAFRLIVPSKPMAKEFKACARSVVAPDWCRGRALRIFYEMAFLPGVLKRMGANLLHAPAYVAPPGLPCPLVVTLYDLHVYTHPHLCRPANRLHYRWRLPGTLRRAAAVIVPSRHTAAIASARFPDCAGKLHVIPLGIAPEHLVPIPPADLAQVRQRHALSGDFLLFVGNLEPRKNLPLLLQAWRLLLKDHPGLELILAGAGAANAPSEAVPRCRRLGYVPEKDLRALYRCARALVYPSRDEGFGLPVLEAMGAGCPVVCSGSAPREFAGDLALYCDPDDPEDIARQVARVLTEGPQRQRMIEEGATIAAQYTWNRAAADTASLYRRVLRETGG